MPTRNPLDIEWTWPTPTSSQPIKDQEERCERCGKKIRVLVGRLYEERWVIPDHTIVALIVRDAKTQNNVLICPGCMIDFDINWHK